MCGQPARIATYLMGLTGALAAFAIHRLASDKLRRSAAWDCGYPDPSPLTQYTASSLSQPIRRVFGTLVFQAREAGEMPPPGATRPARLTVTVRDPVWDTFYAPISGFVEYATERLNVLQFLTIRRYLTLVFMALTEAFRGDVLVWLRLDPDVRVSRCHLRDASWFQWPLLETAIEGNIVADFPLCNKSFNCSYSGHDL